MAVLVHISALEHKQSIKMAGIKPGAGGIVYFLPHLSEYLISHQWARELKRSGTKNFIAVDFRINNEEKVWFGRYNEQHEKMPLYKAIKLLMGMDDKLGYELFIERKIYPNEILRIRRIAKPMGWRYKPGAHGSKPCPCPVCIQAGGYKTGKLKEKYERISRSEAKEIIRNSNDEDELWDAVLRLQGKWKRESPEYLEHLLTFDDEDLLYELVLLVSEYRHPLAGDYLRLLASSHFDDVREEALSCLKKIETDRSKS